MIKRLFRDYGLAFTALSFVGFIIIFCGAVFACALKLIWLILSA